MRRFAVVGLAGFAAIAAEMPARAQGVGQGSSCALSSKVGEQYQESPLAGFDPSAAAPLPVLQANSGAAMVICRRDSLLPQVSDYRVLTEMRLPLAITAGGKTLFVLISKGKLQVAAPDGDLPPDQVAQIQARIDDMQAAMDKARK